MESSWKSKLLSVLLELVKNKGKNLPIYHSMDIHPFLAADESAAQDIKKAAHYTGLVNRVRLDEFINELVADKRLRLSGIAVLKDDRLVAERYVHPFSRGYRHVSYSVCKSVTQMAVGFAVDEGKLELKEKVCDIFPEYKIPASHKEIRELSVRHLLTMTSGAKFDELSAYFSEDWVKSFLESDFYKGPGGDFYYNSLNTYLLAAIVKRRCGCSLMEYLKERLFDPLNITDVTWDLCPKGIERGGWGMKLSLLDMVKLGSLYLNRGAYMKDGEKKQILPKSWVEQSTACHVTLSGYEVVRGYGFSLWLLRDGSYLFNGLFGQNVYINPKRRMVIACFAGGYEIFPEGELIKKFCAFCADDKNFRSNAAGTVFSDMKKLYPVKQKRAGDEKKLELLRPYMDKTYALDGYASSLLPTASQLFYANYRSGLTAFSLREQNGALYFVAKDSKEEITLQVGYQHREDYIYQLLRFGKKEMPAAVCGHISRDTVGKVVLTLRIVYLEETIDKAFQFSFNEDGVRVKAMGLPNMAKFVKKLSEEPFICHTGIMAKLGQTETADEKLRQILFPVCRGTAVPEDE